MEETKNNCQLQFFFFLIYQKKGFKTKSFLFRWSLNFEQANEKESNFEKLNCFFLSLFLCFFYNKNSHGALGKKKKKSVSKRSCFFFFQTEILMDLPKKKKEIQATVCGCCHLTAQKACFFVSLSRQKDTQKNQLNFPDSKNGGVLFFFAPNNTRKNNLTLKTHFI